MNKEELCRDHNIPLEDYERTGLDWSLLEDIAEHHARCSDDLRIDAEDVVRRLQRVPATHSVKWRVKDPLHLVAKIIRKKIEDAKLEISVDNYQDKVTDLLGIRVLHLYKSDWRSIHDFVLANWELHESPVINVRDGDAGYDEETLTECRLTKKIHPAGYRSLHYLIKCVPTRSTRRIIEIQVRTIFEEGWSEIDHQVRYPRHSSSKYLADYLAIFNRLAGNADEMGTYVRNLAEWIEEQDERERGHVERTEELTARILGLVNKMESEGQQVKVLREQIEALKNELEKAKHPIVYPSESSRGGLLDALTVQATGLLVREEIERRGIGIPTARLRIPEDGVGLLSKGFGLVPKCAACSAAPVENVGDICDDCRV